MDEPMKYKIWLNLYTNGFSGIPHDTKREAKQEQIRWKRNYNIELHKTIEIEWEASE